MERACCLHHPRSARHPQAFGGLGTLERYPRDGLLRLRHCPLGQGSRSRHSRALGNRKPFAYVRDGSFAEDASRIRKKPGVFARIRSFAANILRFNRAENVANTRYSLAIGGIAALQSIKFM